MRGEMRQRVRVEGVVLPFETPFSLRGGMILKIKTIWEGNSLTRGE